MNDLHKGGPPSGSELTLNSSGSVDHPQQRLSCHGHLGAHLRFLTSAGGASSIETLCQLSASHLSELLGAAYAYLYLPSHAQATLILAQNASIRRLPVVAFDDQSAFRIVIREMRAVTTPEYNPELFINQAMPDEWIKCDHFIACPLRGRSGLHGVIAIAWIREGLLDQGHLERAKLFAQVLSNALDTINLASDLASAHGALASTQSKLVQQEKVMTLGDLVAGLAHEVNTPLGVALTSLSVAQERAREADAVLNTQSVSRRLLLTYIEEIAQSTSLAFMNLNRAAELVKDFKALSSEHRVGHLEYIEVLHLCHEVGASLQPLLKKYRVTLKVRGDEVRLRTDCGILRGALINLIQNACVHGYGPWDPMTQSPNVTRVIDVHVAPLVDPQKYGVQVRVVDFGVGIPVELHERIFEPFYTTARGRGGTGLGLHLVYSTIQGVLGGQLKLESELGRGASFTLMLPTFEITSISGAHG